MALISVIMGVYNCKDLFKLEKCVQSILNQTWKDWEFIICDDGSTDDTRLMLEELKERDSRIRILHYDTNQGLGYALNYCIRESRGKYIARQDDDDVSAPDRLEKQIHFLEEHPEYAFVGSVAKIYDDRGDWGEYLLPEQPTKHDFLWNNPFLHPSLMFRSEVLENTMYDPSRKFLRCEDYELFMRLYAMGYRGYNMQENLYRYFIHLDPNKKYRKMRFRIIEARVRFRGFRMLGMGLIGIPYVFKPILIGLIPQNVFLRIQFKRYRNNLKQTVGQKDAAQINCSASCSANNVEKRIME